MAQQQTLVPDSDRLSIDGEALDGRDLETTKGPEIYLPDGADMEQVMKHLNHGLVEDNLVQSRLAEAQMRRVIEASQAIEHSFMAGMGQKVAAIPANVFAYWCNKLGPDAWRDGTLLKFLGKSNPGMLIKSKGKVQIVRPDFKGRPAFAALRRGDLPAANRRVMA